MSQLTLRQAVLALILCVQISLFIHIFGFGASFLHIYLSDFVFTHISDWAVIMLVLIESPQKQSFCSWSVVLIGQIFAWWSRSSAAVAWLQCGHTKISDMAQISEWMNLKCVWEKWHFCFIKTFIPKYILWAYIIEFQYLCMNVNMSTLWLWCE
jgi:hypothetical protein